MKNPTLEAMLKPQLNEIKVHSLAGLFALTGDLRTALRIASLEGDRLSAPEILAGLTKTQYDDLRSPEMHDEIYDDQKISEIMKSLYCISLSEYGLLKPSIKFICDHEDVWEYILDDLNSKEDDDIGELVMAGYPFNTLLASKCFSFLVTRSFPSPNVIQGLLVKYPELSLTEDEKDNLIHYAVNGYLTPEEVEVIESIVGRTLTPAEKDKYLHNRFKQLIEDDVKKALDWVWTYQNRGLTKAERRLLRKDVKKTLEAMTGQDATK